MGNTLVPVGVIEIQQRAQAARNTVVQWSELNGFPPPRWTVGGWRAWWWPDVDAWLARTGRRYWSDLTPEIGVSLVGAADHEPIGPAWAVVEPTIDPVARKEIAARVGVSIAAVAGWRKRAAFPPARWRVSGVDTWDWPDVATWAALTGRPRQARGRIPR